MLDADTKLLTAGRPFGAWEERQKKRKAITLQYSTSLQSSDTDSKLELSSQYPGSPSGLSFFP